MPKYKIIYSAEVFADNKDDAEYRIQLNKNLLQYMKTISFGEEVEELDDDFPQTKPLILDPNDPDHLGIIEDLLGKEAYLIEDFDWDNLVTLYFNRNTKTEIFKCPHKDDLNKEFCMAIFEEPKLLMNDEPKRKIMVTETYCDKMSSFVGQIAANFIKMDLENSPNGEAKR